jgi:GDP-L-fucose synthase
MKIHQAKVRRAKTVEICGTEQQRRQFLHVDELADALVFLMMNFSVGRHVNVNCGHDLSSVDVARTIAPVVEYSDTLYFRNDKPGATHRKRLDMSVPT